MRRTADRDDLIHHLSQEHQFTEMLGVNRPGFTSLRCLDCTAAEVRHLERDGARVISGAHLSPTMSMFSEVAMRTLLEHGVPLRQARITVLVVQRFTIGYVLEEQSPPPDPADLKTFSAESFADRHPTVAAGVTEYFQDGRTVDDLFRDSIKQILN